MPTAATPPAVVVGVDGSDGALGAARWAAALAATEGRPLTLLHARSRLERPDADGDAVLAAAAEAVRREHPDLEVGAEAARGSVAAVLAEGSRAARLLVVGTDSHRALGGHAVRVLHRAQCPVALWRAPVAKRTGKPLPVVVGVDDSAASAHALAEAFALACAWHAPLTVAHMWEIDAAVGMGDLGGQGNMDWPLLTVLETQQRRRVEEMVAPLTKKYPNAHVSTVFEDTSPARGLTDLSREAQLVIVGSHGHGRLAEAILGSVSQNLAHHAECPVLLVR